MIGRALPSPPYLSSTYPALPLPSIPITYIPPLTLKKIGYSRVLKDITQHVCDINTVAM